MTFDEAEKRGIEFVQDHLALVRVGFDDKTSLMYAGAMITGITHWIAYMYGRRAAWELMDGLACDLLEQQLGRPK